MSAIRILLADDHHLVRAGIRSLLEGLSDIEVVAETGDGREAIELVRTRGPNLVLMDITMGGMNGLDATAHLLIKITLPPSAKIFFIVGMVAVIRLSSVILKFLSRGTLKSTRIRAF